MDKSTLRVTYLSKGLAWLEFTRANEMNTFTPTQYSELAETLNQLNNDPACSVCVITAYGKLFTAGTDIFSIVGGIRGTKKTPPLKFENEQKEFEYWYEMLQSQAGTVVRALVNFEKILVYAPQAGCVGFGTTISQLCDYVVCSESTWFTTPFMGLNFCAEGGSSYTFPRVLGPHLAREMLLGQKKLTSSEALKSNFVNHVFPDATFKRDTLAFAAKMAFFDQETLKLTKYLIHKHDKDTLLKVNDEELECLARCFAGPKAKKSLIAFVEVQEKRKQKAIEAKKKQELEKAKLFAPDQAKTTDRTERIDRMINSIGGWDQPPPPPGSLTDMTTKLHSQIKTEESKTLLSSKLPDSQQLVIKGQHLQQNKQRTVQQTEDDDDVPIDNNTRVKPPAPKRPFEPIPPLLV